MNRFKKIMKKVFFLPPWLTVLIAVPSFIFVFVMLTTDDNDTTLSYLSYVLSAYAMIITATGITDIIRAMRHGINNIPLIRKIRSIPIGARYLTDPVFRAEVSLYGGLLINLLYVVIKLASGIYYHSLWFIALSAYYAFLSLMRFLLLHHVRRSPIGQEYLSELKRYRLCSGMLLVLNLALSGIVTLVVVRNQGFQYDGYLIYAMAMYTFYTMITSIINVIKFRKYNSPVLSAAKVVNLTAAMVSMLSLETAMLSQFDTTNDPEFRRIMTATTGFVVCVFVLGMAIYMIARANKALAELKIAYSDKRDATSNRQNIIQEVTDYER